MSKTTKQVYVRAFIERNGAEQQEWARAVKIKRGRTQDIN